MKTFFSLINILEVKPNFALNLDSLARALSTYGADIQTTSPPEQVFCSLNVPQTHCGHAQVEESEATISHYNNIDGKSSLIVPDPSEAAQGLGEQDDFQKILKWLLPRNEIVQLEHTGLPYKGYYVSRFEKLLDNRRRKTVNWKTGKTENFVEVQGSDLDKIITNTMKTDIYITGKTPQETELLRKINNNEIPIRIMFTRLVIDDEVNWIDFQVGNRQGTNLSMRISNYCQPAEPEELWCWTLHYFPNKPFVQKGTQYPYTMRIHKLTNTGREIYTDTNRYYTTIDVPVRITKGWADSLNAVQTIRERYTSSSGYVATPQDAAKLLTKKDGVGLESQIFKNLGLQPRNGYWVSCTQIGLPQTRHSQMVKVPKDIMDRIGFLGFDPTESGFRKTVVHMHELSNKLVVDFKVGNFWGSHLALKTSNYCNLESRNNIFRRRQLINLRRPDPYFSKEAIFKGNNLKGTDETIWCWTLHYFPDAKSRADEEYEYTLRMHTILAEPKKAYIDLPVRITNGWAPNKASVDNIMPIISNNITGSMIAEWVELNQRLELEELQLID